MITPRNTFHMLTKQTRKSKLSVIKQRKAGNIYILFYLIFERHCLSTSRQGFPFSARQLANASVKTVGIVSHSPVAQFGEWNFHLKEINQTFNCHGFIFLTKHN